jgi:hypothetical protein
MMITRLSERGNLSQLSGMDSLRPHRFLGQLTVAILPFIFRILAFARKPSAYDNSKFPI